MKQAILEGYELEHWRGGIKTQTGQLPGRLVWGGLKAQMIVGLSPKGGDIPISQLCDVYSTAIS